jgi:endonuclease YncB( thermonuclease family)
MRGFLFALIFSYAVFASAEPLVGWVVGVTDGDSITVLDASKVQHKVRLSGIDAPEKSQPFGNRSKESLSELVFKKSVTVDGDKKDRYGRSVGKVIANGLDVNLIQIERGMAWFYRQYQREQSPEDRKLYDAAEAEAKRVQLGFWRDEEPMPPWDYRKSKRR